MINLEDGITVEGITDDNGLTKIVKTIDKDLASLHIFDENALDV